MKKKEIYLTIILGAIFFAVPVSAVNLFCTGLKSTFKIVGEIVRLVKIIVPIVLIVIGIMDLFKAITGGKDDNLKKSLISLMTRVIAGVIIFFVPAIIEFVFSLIDNWVNNYENSYKECITCVLNVSECE